MRECNSAPVVATCSFDGSNSRPTTTTTTTTMGSARGEGGLANATRGARLRRSFRFSCTPAAGRYWVPSFGHNVRGRAKVTSVRTRSSMTLNVMRNKSLVFIKSYYFLDINCILSLNNLSDTGTIWYTLLNFTFLKFNALKYLQTSHYILHLACENFRILKYNFCSSI